MTYLRSIVFVIPFMCLWSDSAVAWQTGLGGGDLNSTREVQEEGIIITWPETNDELRGFSQKLGEWEVLKIDPQKLNPGQIINPVVAANVAAVRCGDSIAAFSADTGWWDVIDLAKGSTAYPSVSASLVKIDDNGHLYTFSSSRGEWTSPTDPEFWVSSEYGARLEESPSSGRGELTAWYNQLPAHKARGITIGNGPLGVITIRTTRESWMKETLEKINEIRRRNDATIPDRNSITSNQDSSEFLSSQISSLKVELLKIENEIQVVAAKSKNPDLDAPTQTRELRKLVEQSFDLRQQLQELEAQRLRLKLQQVENNLAVRAKSRDAMVERRMEELRRPDSGNNVVPQDQDNRSTSRDNSVGSESSDSRVGDVRIENEDSKTQWLQPREVARLLRSLRESAIRDMEEIRDPNTSVETWSQPLEKLIADGLLEAGSGEDERQRRLVYGEDLAKGLEINLHGTRRDWGHAWSGYQTQLQLLRLDVEQAKSKADLMASQHTRASELHAAGNIAREKLDEINAAFTASKLNLQRAEQMLKLYADIETNEPELNPATLKGLDEIAASKETTASVPNEPGQNLPQQVISMAEQLRKLREAAEKFRKERQPPENLITQYSRPLEQLKTEGVVSAEMTEEHLKTQIARSKPEFDRLTREFDTAMKAWKQAWSAYRSQSKLLDLDVRDAEAAKAAAELRSGRIQVQSEAGLLGPLEASDAEAQLKAAMFKAEKTEEMLRMWQQLEKNESELNPDWKPESSGKNVPD